MVDATKHAERLCGTAAYRQSTRIAAAAFAAIALLLAGCADTGNIAPRDNVSEVASLEAGAAIHAASGEAGWPDERWWTAYGDAQLNQLVQSAIAGNPSLTVARARVREAHSLADVARAQLMPQIDGTLSFGRQHFPDNAYYGPGPFRDRTAWNNTAGLTLSYDLDVWHANRNAHESALDDARAEACAERAAQLMLEVRVVSDYVTLAEDYQLRDIAAATLAQQRKIADIAQRRFAGGMGTQLDVSQSHTPLPEDQRQIDLYDERISLSRNQIAALLGDGPGQGDMLTRPQLTLRAPVGLPAAVPAELLGRRPDVVAARWNVAAHARGIDVAKAQFYPNVNLLASISQMAAGGTFLAFLHSGATGWNAGPAITLPIFEGGRLRAQLGAASASYDASVDYYNATLVAALRDIADDVVRLQSLDGQTDDASRAVDVAQRNYALANQAYQRGLTDYLNVLAARSELLRAQVGQAKVLAQRLSAYASLQGALGGGFDESKSSPTAASVVPARDLVRSGHRTPRLVDAERPADR